MVISVPTSPGWFRGNGSPHITQFLHRSLPNTTDTTFPVFAPLDIKKTEINWVIGTTLGAFCYGFLLSLGLRCLRALRSLPPQRGFLNQRMLLMLHVTSVTLLNAAFQINTTRENLFEIFYTRPEALTYFYMDKWNFVVVVIFALTDGLLVWRCYMVQKVLLRGKRASWQHFFWVFPLSLWLVMIGVGAYSTMVTDSTTLLSTLPDVFVLTLLLTCIVGNILVNLFATSYIVIRLLIHRRSMIASFGHSASIPRFHVRIISILLESAIVNFPVAILTMVSSVMAGGWAHMFWQISVPAQTYSSVLVIYQVARGRAIGSESLHTKNTDPHNLDTIGDSMYSP